MGPLTDILRPDSAFVKSDLIGFPPTGWAVVDRTCNRRPEATERRNAF